MSKLDEYIFKLTHVENKLKKIHEFVREVGDDFKDTKKTRRLLTITKSSSEDLNLIESICLRLNNIFIKDPSCKPDGFDVDKHLSHAQDLVFDIDSAIELARLSLGEVVEPEKKVPTTHTSEFDSVSNSLPAIKLTEFDGSSLLAWLQFRDLFSALVIQDSKLPTIKKFLYLRSCIKGQALSLVSSLPISADNFDLAWKLLCDRYNDDRSLTSYFLESIFDFSTITRNSLLLKQSASSIKESLGALQQIGHPIDEWNPILIFLLRRKLSKELLERWEASILSTSNPTHSDFIEFLANEAKVVEGLSPNPSKDRVKSPQLKCKQNKPLAFNMTTGCSPSTGNSANCLYCHKNHWLSSCPGFAQNTPKDRYNFVKANSLCCRCLSNKHFINRCRSSFKCGYCNSSNHNSLLHFDKKPASDPVKCVPNSTGNDCSPVKNFPLSGNLVVENNMCEIVNKDSRPEVVLLSTVVAYIKNSRNKLFKVRILLDTGSQGTFVTKSVVNSCSLPVIRASVPIQGMSQINLGKSLGKTNLKIVSLFDNDFCLDVEALVVEKLARCPQISLENSPWLHLHNLKLADPTWYEPGDIDVLLGSEYLAQVLIGNPVIGPKGSPSAIETIWGYTLVGKVSGAGSGSLQSYCGLTNLEVSVKKFWEIEEPPSVHSISEDDKLCAEIFDQTISRLDSGRFVVSLPFKRDRSPLGESRNKALNRFLSLESRLCKNPTLHKNYCDFMNDYLQQGHMTLTKPLSPGKEHYYVPHHSISSSKFKVVFDFSMPTSSGFALNQSLYSGEKLLLNLLDILLKFRSRPVVLIADICQFYRNIALSDNHWDYQRIFWRDSPSKNLLEYCLTTVTYGVVSSPYLAIRTIHKLVELEGEPYPLASAALLESAYMDDVVRSVETLDDGFRLREELINLMAKGGFKLKKWVSNRPELLVGLKKEDISLQNNNFEFSLLDADTSAKILGLAWNPSLDTLSYRVNFVPQEITKRKILSELAQLWDPLGLLCPSIFVGKLILRFVWQLGLNWDDTPPQDVCQKWTRFRSELPLLKTFKIPRLMSQSLSSLQLHCFADASENGYGSVLYFRDSSSDNIKLSLILAKTKISPLKKISLPRLELCSVVLAAKLVHYVKNLFVDIQFQEIIIWSDSMVSLHWVKSSPHRWKTFVANRVAQIQDLTPSVNFRYVPTNLNIADLASRGCFPSELASASSWWAGPEFLFLLPDDWPQIPSSLLDKGEALREAKEVKVLASFISDTCKYLESFSSLSHLRRLTAWFFRFIHNLKIRCKISRTLKDDSLTPELKHSIVQNLSFDLLTGPITTFELRTSLLFWIKFIQARELSHILNSLKNNKLLDHSSRKLCPFIDPDGILRVGGRLQNSSLSISGKHPILLPKNSHLTKLIIEYFHQFWLHPGPSTLHNIIRSQFWIFSGRTVIKKLLSKCLNCFKIKPPSIQPLMGNLPASRLHQIKPFGITGVDFAGPLIIKSSRLRKAPRLKAYICLFVCFATKAVHLELASDLSTDTFLAAFRRFVARRGPVFEVHSDNGTNFVGAKNKLDHWYHLINSSEFRDKTHHWAGESGIKWSFTPSFSAHMGSIWEANIKSTKRLLFASVGLQVLTFEELTTVLVQIEAVLNSRPLTPNSSDPNDLQPLTPSHFLLQGPPGSIVEPDPSCEPLSLRNRWKLIQQIVASFWHRWHLEYLSSLQLRYKWNKSAPNLDEGSLVLLKDPNLPPLKWKLGRIVRTYPGKDGISRVADVKLSSGFVVNRAVVKLCPLPLDN